MVPAISSPQPIEGVSNREYDECVAEIRSEFSVYDAHWGIHQDLCLGGDGFDAAVKSIEQVRRFAAVAVSGER